MKTELAPTSSDLSLLPRADLPVIWDGFRAKVQELHQTAQTLTVTSIEQKAEMELARTTRLTLKQIRVEVEKKRVELGEGHLSEIQKINKAAKAIKEAIEPLEARLLHQEQFADRVEADRLVELEKTRNDEVRSIRPGWSIPGVSSLKQEEYEAVLVRLRAEAAEIAEAKRRQAEAEAALAARVAEEKRLRDEQAQAFLAQQAEAQRQARVAAAEAEVRLAAERAERRRQEQELIERLAREQAEKDAKRAAQEVEENRARAEVKRIEREEYERRDAALRAELGAANAKRAAERAIEEAKRLELEVQLANERAAKLAEEERLRKLAVAPDLIKLRAYYDDLKDVPLPNLSTQDAERALIEAVKHVSLARTSLDIFCKRFEQA